MKLFIPLCATLALAGCSTPILTKLRPDAQSAQPSDDQLRPVARPSGLQAAPKPASGARTAEQFDTTSASDRAKAASVTKTSGEVRLGTTIASLGDPTKPGFWIETPLVAAPAVGRVVYPATGKASQVDLIPIDGPKTAGSRLSLAAMRLIGAPLTGLPEIEVYSGS